MHGPPRNGVVADFMCRTRASYHYAVRVKHNEELVVCVGNANAYMNDPNRSLWVEVKKNTLL